MVVNMMSEGEAVQLLEKRLGDTPKDGAAQLVKILDYIPIAIVQQAAYISRLHPAISVQRYLVCLFEFAK
jgi:hypothetical protein